MRGEGREGVGRGARACLASAPRGGVGGAVRGIGGVCGRAEPEDKVGGGREGGVAVGREPGSAASTKDGEAPGPRRGGGSALTWDTAEAPKPVVIC